MIAKFKFDSFFLLYLTLYISMLVGFFFNENSTGGAILDYQNQKIAAIDFANNFFLTFLNYENYNTRHSPVLIILLSFFEKFNVNDLTIRFLHLHFSLILPFLFFLILKEKFNLKKNEIFYVIVGIIFLSPTYRSLSIWPDSRLIGLIFFCISIIFYLKFVNKKKKIFCILNILFYALSAYLSPNFSVYSIFFFYKFFLFYKKDLGFLVLIILINLLLAFPAFYYIFILDVNFINKSAAVGFAKNNILFSNVFNNILLIASIFLFYLIPFIQTKIISLSKFKFDFSILLFLSIMIISIYFFDYNYLYTGGGIFFKINYFLFKNNILFFVISSISLFVVYLTCIDSKSNLLIFLCLLISTPQETIYHKYFDPLLIILIFSLLNFKVNILKISLKNHLYLYFYFTIFLFISLLKIYV